ncbi:MAG TPA: hypothetical protein DCW55_01565 [Candidatus Pacebacteria bacterium]|nr:hypothetical protein [Candidatus Paceibacterota bacterium]HAX01145.1 hypothetical protein [Candidatus Paceibacterota bacterium]
MFPSPYDPAPKSHALMIHPAWSPLLRIQSVALLLSRPHQNSRYPTNDPRHLQDFLLERVPASLSLAFFDRATFFSTPKFDLGLNDSCGDYIRL